MDELLADFLSDAAESLEIVEADLLRLESRPGDAAIINAVLRQLHTVKGACGFLGLTRLSVLVETSETFLSAARGAPVTPAGADAMLRCLDRIKGVIAGLNATGAEPAGDDSALLSEMIAAIGDSARGPSLIADESPAPTSVRISAAALDSLAELAADLTRARAALLHTLDTPGAEKMRAPLMALAKTAGDMVALTEHLRRRPAGEAWRPLRRVVREASAALGKQVELVLEGEEIELDAYVVDAIKGPLMHLARNAVAHGVETPTERVSLGKPACGTLRIAVLRHNDGAATFEIADDGAGLDPATIRRRGIENGMISAAQAARLNDQDTLDLLFTPGFSTAAKINALAGRGIGLDAVRTAVERLGARLEVDARPGAGATFRIKIPGRAIALAPADATLERLSPQLAAAGYEIAASAALEETPPAPAFKELSA